jgi:phosphotransferase system enzyme I (PtsI)
VVLGFVSEHGGYTSHAAILARSLGVPAVTGLKDVTDEIVEGETVIVDGFKGLVIVQPDEEQLQSYQAREERFLDRRRAVIAQSARPAVTSDGTRIHVQANVAGPEDLTLAREYDADGVGLYRTEVEYLSHSSLPPEDRLAEEYSRAVELFAEEGVTFRALDIGGDKFPPSVPLAHEENPFIGMRGLRLLLEHVEDLMVPQLRAIARASAAGRTSIMYPMIASVADMEAALELFQRAVDEARKEGHAVAEELSQGIMIEVPSCVPMLPELLAECSFGSVGTNDLVQYLLAADRNSERMVDAYDPFHPAVLRTLATIYESGRTADRELSVCGEAASDPPFLALLIGLGYRTVSVNVGAIPRVKGIVRELSVEDCEELAREALRARTGDATRAAARDFVAQYAESVKELA